MAPDKHNLPAHLPSLIGRDADVPVVRRRLLDAQAGVLTLTGAGGSGKTRLALAVAATVLNEFADGVWLVEFAPVGDPGLVPGAVAAAVGVQEQPGRTASDTLLEVLKTRVMLLVLDNCEHLVGACASLIVALLRGCPGLRILATSREPLRTPGELTWRVPPLSLPDEGTSPIAEAVACSAAVQLFVERARAVQPAFALTDQNSNAVAALSVRLEGLPLAIELAAARAEVLSPEQILARLDDAFGLLVGGSRTAPTRQQTLRKTLDWSYLLLEPREQELFAWLAVFAGSFDLEAAEAVCDVRHSESTVPLELVDTLSRLVDKSLVLVQELSGDRRFRMHETVRQYAHGKLVERDQWTTARHQHAAYFLALAEQSERAFKGAGQGAWLARLELEHDNMRAVMRRCLDAAEPETALRVGSALMHFWRHAGYRNEGHRWLEESLEKGVLVGPAVRAKALHHTGVLARRLSNYSRARECFQQSLTLWRELGDPLGTALVLDDSGTIVARTSDQPEEVARGIAMVRESLAILRQLGHRYHLAGVLHSLGEAAWEQADLTQSRAALEESAAILSELGEDHIHNHVIYFLGAVARDQGDLARATVLLEDSLLKSRQASCASGTGGALYHLALLARRQGDVPGSTTACLESLMLNYGNRQLWDVASCFELLAGLAADTGQSDRSARLLAAAAKTRHDIGVPLPPVTRPMRDGDLASTRDRIGPTRFASAWTQGQAMTIDEAVNYAHTPAVAQADPQRAVLPRDVLTRREREIAALLTYGYTNREIAEVLVISERTADGHVANILGKLELRSRAQVAVWAIEHELPSARR